MNKELCKTGEATKISTRALPPRWFLWENHNNHLVANRNVCGKKKKKRPKLLKRLETSDEGFYSPGIRQGVWHWEWLLTSYFFRMFGAPGSYVFRVLGLHTVGSRQGGITILRELQRVGAIGQPSLLAGDIWGLTLKWSTGVQVSCFKADIAPVLIVFTRGLWRWKE